MLDKKSYPLVEVTWEDACGVSIGWEVPETIKTAKLSLINSCGYLIEEDKKRIIIATSLGQNHIQGTLCIPKSNITSFKKRKKK